MPRRTSSSRGSASCARTRWRVWRRPQSPATGRELGGDRPQVTVDELRFGAGSTPDDETDRAAADDDPPTGDDGPWVGVSEDLQKYNGILRYTRSTPDDVEWNVMLMAYDAEWNSADQIPMRAVEAGLISPLGTIDDTVGGDTSRYSLSGRWHRDVGDQQFTARAYAIDYELDLFSNFTYFLDDPQNGDQFEQVDDRVVYGGRYLPTAGRIGGSRVVCARRRA